MKLKHWQGYGSVNAQVVWKEDYGSGIQYAIKVWGNHECGLDRSDIKDSAIEWLNKVMKDKNITALQNLKGHDRYQFLQDTFCAFEELPYEHDASGCTIDAGRYIIQIPKIQGANI